MAIELKDALQILESGDWCHLCYITADEKKGTGGKVIELPKCRIARRQPAASAAGAGKSASLANKKRNANHNLHFTRNVELFNKSILTVHVPLIYQINGVTVLLSSILSEETE